MSPHLLTSIISRTATAQVQCLQGTGPVFTCDTGLPAVNATYSNVQTILQLLFGVIGAIALIIIIVAAIRFITSQGDPQGVAKARQALIYAVIGLAVAVSAELIVTFVLNNV